MPKIYVIGILCLLYLLWFYNRVVPAHTAYLKKHALRAMGGCDLPPNWERNRRSLMISMLFAFIAWVYLIGLLIYYFFFT